MTLGDKMSLALDRRSSTATLNGRIVRLAPTEFDLLSALAEEAPRPVSYPALSYRVWGSEMSDMQQRRNLKWYVSQLRRKLGPEIIANERRLKNRSHGAYRLTI